MVASVNALRRLGKPRALGVLREYAVSHEKESRQEDRVALICFLLFINPDGWRNIRHGAPSPDVNLDVVRANFPLFPLALSRGVPFLLVNGYRTGAMSSTHNESLRYVATCERLSMITHDLPTHGFERAAEDLIHSSEFRNLYSNTNEIPNEMILDEAGPTWPQ